MIEQLHRGFFKTLVAVTGIVLIASCSRMPMWSKADNEPAHLNQPPSETAHPKVEHAYAKLPLSFIKNEGQLDPKVVFYEQGNGHATFFTKDGVYLSVLGASTDTPNGTPAISHPRHGAAPLKPAAHHRRSELVKVLPLGANTAPMVVAEGLQEGKVNYFIGNDPKKWKTNVPTYQAVVYKEIYPGIDMKFYGNHRQMEYDIIVQPGADPAKVKLAYEGIEELRVTDEGDLEIALKGGAILQKKPVIYQEIDGKRVEVAGAFTIEPRAKRTSAHRFAYGFQVASYDTTHPLVIDPTLVYSTYLGGNSAAEFGRGIAVDASGNAYVTGGTGSTDFPTVNPIQAAYGGGGGGVGIGDAFVAKINAAGTALVYSTYFGGSDFDVVPPFIGSNITVDSSGNAYVTGGTRSTDFPTLNALQTTNRGGDEVYVAKLNAQGALVYSTYLGGSGDDVGFSITVDSSGNAYVTGNTGSACIDINTFCFPTTAGAFQPFFGGGTTDAFVAKINAAGTGLVYSTYLAYPEVAGTERGNGIAVDASGYAWVTGSIFSGETPDALLLALITPAGDSGGIRIEGGSGIGYGIAVDASGNAYVTGRTESFATVNAIQAAFGGGAADAFVAKIGGANNFFSDYVYATYLGGSGTDTGYGIAVDASGNVYVTGETASLDFPSANAIQAAYGGGIADVFVTKINAAGTSVLYSTYLGGSGWEGAYSIAVNGYDAYATGFTQSTNFPTANPIQAALNADQDAFVAKLSPSFKELFGGLRLLIDETFATNTSQGIDNSLDAKLDAAQSALDSVRANSVNTALNQLDAFINETQAQSGNLITTDQANQLIDAANQIKAVLESP
jgi:hypothetical protein